MVADPCLRTRQVARDRDRVSSPNLIEQCTSRNRFAIKNGLDEGGYLLRTERSHRRGQVEAVIPHDRCHQLETFKSDLRGVFGTCKVRRHVYAPLGEPQADRFEPFPDACLACMDLLPAADETDDYRPSLVSIEVRDQKFRFRLVEVLDLLPSPHEISCLCPRPSTLRFIKDHDVIVGCARRANTVISEVVDVLDEGFDALSDGPLSFSLAKAYHFVPSERLLKDIHKRPVAGKVYRVRFAQCPPASRHVQTHKRLAGAGHTRDEHDGLLAVCAGVIDCLLYPNGCLTQVFGTGIAAGDSLDRVPRVKSPGRFNDCGRRMIRGGAPSVAIDRSSAAVSETVVDGLTHVVSAALIWRSYTVRVRR